ncbi:DNA helicase [Pseudomonas capeferrum]|uniref:DEAD/DEAH box helicase n=1 Tax=Pseudomonas capeferrum TaxID=1495066 RepID=UPI0015E31344|nr:ATP-binding protein [Pseudomonas capeferrum]MBA1200344.1 DNA helicase [Pseudomonas capeferrum]
MDQPSIVRYWHAVELLQPQSVPKLKSRDEEDHYQPFYHDIPAAEGPMPWQPESLPSKQKLPEKRVWSHTLYAHLYDNLTVAKALETLYGADQGYTEPRSRETALYALKFTDQGMMVTDSLVLSSEAWFLGHALAGNDWTHGFEGAQEDARHCAKALLGDIVTTEGLEQLTQYIRQSLGLDAFFGEQPRQHRFRSAPINPDKPIQEDDPLNSFLLSDLADVASALERGETSAALDLYLQQHSPDQRLHLDDGKASLALLDRLSPARHALGCWPSEDHLGLVHSQQLAVNSILHTLSDAPGILGVNGPPGTGKTTLLRDLVAAVVTQRADVLASFDRAAFAFEKDGREVANDGGREQTAYRLKPELFGFEMVVASSNNGAVENVTLELPQRDKIDESWIAEIDYFSELGELTTGKPAWGMISAALGSKAKRTQFVNRFFYGETPSKPDAKENQREPNPLADLEEAEVLAQNEDLYVAELEQLEDSSEKDALDSTTTPKGFLGWLTQQAEIEWTSDERLRTWQTAVQRYKEARHAAEALGADASQIGEMIRGIIDTQTRIADVEAQACRLQDNRRELESQQSTHDIQTLATAHNALELQVLALNAHLERKPRWIANLLSLGSASRDWAAKQKLLDSSHGLARGAHDTALRQAARLADQLKELDSQLAAHDLERAALREQTLQRIDSARELARTYDAQHVVDWLDSGVVGHGSDIERSEPWVIPGWRQARAKVFIEALNLHRAFFQLEAKRLRCNLYFANSMLTNGHYQGMSRELVRSAWASLFMVVPVLSSTFASFARSFGSLKCGEIGWLLVDEAGQATPQSAVGALWRAKRAVLVGDPLQLKPIVSVSDAVLERMRTRYQVDPHWLCNRQSAQTLADQATPWGKLLGPRGQKNWVGLPLVVHRRCDRPMFDLANLIAYDGAMAYGTRAPSADKETSASLATGWLHAPGPSSGNWVRDEGIALKRLLERLKADGVPEDGIAVITPFQDVRAKLAAFLPPKIVFGTIHTMQGKEAAVIVLVLGGSTENPGARDWAVCEPNLLNVAATRAKRRLYVIGDREDWKNRALFREVMAPERNLLPLRVHGMPVVSDAPA